MAKIADHLYLDRSDFDDSDRVNAILGRTLDTWRTPWADGWADAEGPSIDYDERDSVRWIVDVLVDSDRWPTRGGQPIPALEIVPRIMAVLDACQARRRRALVYRSMEMRHGTDSYAKELRGLSAEAKRLRAALAVAEPLLREELRMHERSARTIRKLLGRF